MNGIDRNLGVVGKHLKHIKLTFTFISLIVLLAVSSIALVASAQELDEEDVTVVVEEQTDEEVTDETESSDQTEDQAVTTVNNDAALDTRTQERIINLAANVSNRLEAAIVRLEKISTRLDSRLHKISNERPDLDLSVPTQHLSNAQDSLATAREIMDGIDMVVNQAVRSESPMNSWSDVRNRYQMTKQRLIIAHEELADAVYESRQALAGNNQINISEEAASEETEIVAE